MTQDRVEKAGEARNRLIKTIAGCGGKVHANTTAQIKVEDAVLFLEYMELMESVVKHQQLEISNLKRQAGL